MKKNVLIVEDSPVWATLLKQYCESIGLESRVADSPQAVLDELDRQPSDLILLDMLLATETGMALLNEMKSYDDLSKIPVVVCSSVLELDIEELKPYGVVEIVDKATTTPDEIKQILRRVLYE